MAIRLADLARGALVPALLAWPLAALGAEPVGRAEVVLVWATARPAGASERTVYVHDAVFAQETLRTVEDGGLHVVLRDRTELRLGSDASVTLDEFIFDGRPGTGRLVGSVSRGIARFISGQVDKKALTIRTPAAFIGVRGTDFSVWVEEGGRTTIWVNDGAIVVTPLGGVASEVGEGETVAIEAGGGPLQRDALRPPGEPGLSDRLLIGR